ncbi:uncharacterized protein LOC128041377 isoform X3 [Gossypium raimondii]|uniref:Uncharacterized protein n=2 Tax=Gossypium raimondii TaxID=29730 RepID=A0A0D2UY16_GOSRA|nr:uncharacterized protein LOC128041377 isoform X3 [Gossypium raimondii]XP_052487722.1 uncharacterized protein LOC128041377 isoform X3 [Gossypium raimondii]XP_052487723.1 uncharacterized protein LOC128041377 isoform X3 [Gossypium raimondii]XP_052487724.1 uncharacterized protein LOC128041377 isoform X3 [Gossypium raimondii]XP_052487725.1 uncharacterized protein LOC128041377 isoform X3 [Gossypium raimondii]KJB61085.1 hypothetical protein B456_009G344600 [Gossypium raimondii]
MLTHRRSSAKASSLPTILMTPISTKKIKKNRFNYGGGAAALKTGQAMASVLNVVQTSHSYGDLMLLMKAAELQQV